MQYTPEEGLTRLNDEVCVRNCVADLTGELRRVRGALVSAFADNVDGPAFEELTLTGGSEEGCSEYDAFVDDLSRCYRHIPGFFNNTDLHAEEVRFMVTQAGAWGIAAAQGEVAQLDFGVTIVPDTSQGAISFFQKELELWQDSSGDDKGIAFISTLDEIEFWQFTIETGNITNRSKAHSFIPADFDSNTPQELTTFGPDTFVVTTNQDLYLISATSHQAQKISLPGIGGSFASTDFDGEHLVFNHGLGTITLIPVSHLDLIAE